MIAALPPAAKQSNAPFITRDKPLHWEVVREGLLNVGRKGTWGI
jgi:hypothetical protein